MHPSPHVLAYMAVPQFDPKNTLHIHLAQLSECCHDARTKGDKSNAATLESEIDKAAAQLWGITENELKAIQDALKGMEKPGASRSKKSTTGVCKEQQSLFPAALEEK